jgi:hypothetical protein
MTKRARTGRAGALPPTPFAAFLVSTDGRFCLSAEVDGASLRLSPAYGITGKAADLGDSPLTEKPGNA